MMTHQHPSTHEERGSKGRKRHEQIPLPDGGSKFDPYSELLANARRRYILDYARKRESAELVEVAEYVAECEGREQRELDHPVQLQIDLHHSQLPRLDDIGLIDYDPRSGMVCCDRLPEPVDSFLDQYDGLETQDDEDGSE